MTEVQAFIDRGWSVRIYPTFNGLWLASAGLETQKVYAALCGVSLENATEKIVAFMAQEEKANA